MDAHERQYLRRLRWIIVFYRIFIVVNAMAIGADLARLNRATYETLFNFAAVGACVAGLRDVRHEIRTLARRR
jgi:uncharacterized membrane protein YhhN